MARRPDRQFVLALSLALLACGRSDPLPPEPLDLTGLTDLVSSPPPRRSVIIAVDGLPGSICSRVFRRPHLATLAASGCRGLEPGAGGRASAWATLVAGASPGEHGVFADSEVAFWAPEASTGRRQWGQGPRGVPPFWAAGGGAALVSVILGVPDDFPPTPMERSRQVVGAGLPGPERPDAPGFAVGFSDVEGLVTLGGVPTTGGVRLALPLGDVGRGLPPVPLLVRQGRIRQNVEGRPSVELIPGGWSAPLELDLEGGGGRRLSAWTRIWTVGLAPLRIVIQPLSADARAPWLPLSHPPTAALELQQRVGRFRSANRSADRAAVAAGVLPREAYEQDLLASANGRMDQAAWALDRWEAALVLLALPELAELSMGPSGSEQGLDVIEAALSRLWSVAADAELTLVSVRGLAHAEASFDPATFPDLGGGVRFGLHGAVRLAEDVSPTRARRVLARVLSAAEAEPLIRRVESRADWPGPRAGLAPNLRLVAADGARVVPSTWSETGGVVMGILARSDRPFLADLGPVTMSRLVSE